jgi:protein O-GlcNAc transferase
LEARYNLGVCCEERGLAEEAVRHLLRVLAMRPSLAAAHMTLGNAYKRLGDGAAALNSYRHAVSLDPKSSTGHYNLANVLGEQGSLDDAVAHYQRALAETPGFVDAHINLGNVLLRQGRPEEALEHHKVAVEAAPECAAAHASIGNTYKALYKQRMAVVHYGRALSLKPDSWRVLTNLGSVLMQQGRLEEAKAAFDHAHTLRPDSAEIHSYLGRVLRAQGRSDQALPVLEKAIELQPDSATLLSSLLLSLNYSASYDGTATFQRHVEFGRKFSDHLPPLSSPVRCTEAKSTLRIGYVSADFRKHSVAFFIEPVLQNHDVEKFEIFAYYNHYQDDDTTQRIRHLCRDWRSIYSMPDERVAELIRNDRIDILVDLNGHTAHNRLLAFARHPAPIQVTWLGYPNTTGMRAMGYRITDSITDPPGQTEHLYTEQLVRIPGCFSCYRSPEDAPEVGVLPARKNGYITFGSFNNFSKVTPRALQCFAEILRNVEASRLMLKSLALGEEFTRQYLRDFFASQGISTDRLIMLGKDPIPTDHLARYGGVDVALDTFPYNGTTTTCEALWMGVPVVALVGDSHASRVSTSFLTALGLEEFAADTIDRYVTTAAALAGDMGRLEKLRRGMRERMSNSIVMDAARFTRQLEEAYDGMWRRRASDEAAADNCSCP